MAVHGQANIDGEFRYAQPVANGPEILTGISQTEIDALCALVKPGDRVLEVGTAYGYSAICMALHGASVVTVDDRSGVETDQFERAADNIRQCGVGGRVFMATADSDRLLPFLYGIGSRFDGVFVDGGSEQTGRDVSRGWQMLIPGGWLARHDYRETGSPRTTQLLDLQFPDGPDEVVRTLWIKRRP